MGNFTQLTNNLNIIQGLSDSPNQNDNLTSAQLKAKFDEAVNIIKTFLNSTLISELQASGGADKVGALVGGIASNLQTFINNVESAGVGNLPPSGSVTNTMMATDVKIGSLASLTTTSKTSIQSAINEINAKQSASDILTTQGDLMYRNATVPTRLPKGTSNQLLRMNSGATAPEWMALGTAYQGLGVSNTGTALQWLATLQSLMTSAGDILYANSPNTPVSLPKGTVYQGLRMNNSGTYPEWGNVMIGEKQIITATGTTTFTAPKTGIYKVTVTGGGGSSPRTTSSAGGGGAGGTAIKFVSLTLNDAITVTVGAGGTVPASGDVDGVSGNNSSFGTHCTGNGGSGGTRASNAYTTGGSGGNATNGDINIKGGKGTETSNSNTAICNGGSSFWVGEGAYGSGGGCIPNNFRNGTNGVVMIEW